MHVLYHCSPLDLQWIMFHAAKCPNRCSCPTRGRTRWPLCRLPSWRGFWPSCMTAGIRVPEVGTGNRRKPRA